MYTLLSGTMVQYPHCKPLVNTIGFTRCTRPLVPTAQLKNVRFVVLLLVLPPM